MTTCRVAILRALTTSVAKHRELGLTDPEYDGICERLGREPNALELAVFSLMWSEHCAYKHSKKLLGRLPTEGPHVVMGPGENAGAVDVGDGLVVAFKVESHNHPSAVGDRLSIPVKHTTGRYYAPEHTLDELEAEGQVLLRYAAGQNPNGALRPRRPGGGTCRQG